MEVKRVSIEPQPGLLDGLRVIEVSSFVAAPLGGMTLAQLGAEVIRIDPVGGGADINRWPVADTGTSLYWTGLNKAKRSVTIDLKSSRGRALVTDLICDPDRGSGIVLTNAGRSSWLSYEALSALRPDLIHVQIDGNSDGSPAVDYTINAATGFPWITGPEGWVGPVNHVLPAWDVACGLYAAIALLSADRQRLRTGAGSRLRISLEDVALATAGNLGFLAEAQVNQTDRPRIGNHLYGSLARDFGTRDGRRIMIVALTRRHWLDLLSLTGLTSLVKGLEAELGTDLSDEAERYKYRSVVTGLLEPWFAEREFADAAAALSSSSVLWSGYRTFSEVIEERLAEGSGSSLLSEIDQPGIGRYLAPASPIAMGAAGTVRRAHPAPTLGADSSQVLAGTLGLTADHIRELLAAGVVADSSTTDPVGPQVSRTTRSSR
jgi:2-methylfumaryl-CoA isomerase